MKDFCLSVLFLCFVQLLNAQTYSVSLVLYGCPLAELASVEKNASPKFLNERYPHTVLYSFRLGKNGVFRKDDMKDLRRETSWDASVPVSERKKFDAVKAEFGSKIEAKLSDINGRGGGRKNLSALRRRELGRAGFSRGQKLCRA